MNRKYIIVSLGLILGILCAVFVLSNRPSEGYLEVFDDKEEKVGIIICHIYYVKWHGRTTNLHFFFYRRSRVAGKAVPGLVGATWNKTNGEVVGVRDHSTCAARNGDTFRIVVSICCAYAEVSYDNKTVHFGGSGHISGLEDK